MHIQHDNTNVRGDIAIGVDGNICLQYRWWKLLILWLTCGLYKPWYVVRGDIDGSMGVFNIGIGKRVEFIGNIKAPKHETRTP